MKTTVLIVASCVCASAFAETGRAVFAEGAERERLEEVFLTAAPKLRRIYNKKPGKRMMCFTLVDSRAELIPMMPPGEVLLDETRGARIVPLER